MNASSTDVLILGAGPYGLSIAAHLNPLGVPYRIFGLPMHSWQNMMPKGMSLKSEGFASGVYDPEQSFTLAHYCRETRQPYADVGLPVPLERFVAYGLEFQKRLVPTLDKMNLTSIKRTADGFESTSEAGEVIRSRRVVVAAGIAHFGYLPPALSGVPEDLVTHSSQHSDLSKFRGRHVVVVGAGASAVDIAAILHEEGAQVELVARVNKIAFHEPPNEPRPLIERLKRPRSTIGLGWRSRLAVDAPLVFHMLPQDLRHRVVRKHLGPAPGWFVREKVEGKFPAHLNAEVKSVEAQGNKVRVRVGENGTATEIVADHVIGGTGYRVSLQRLKFLDRDLRTQIRAAEDTPVLDPYFETSVPGLYFVGASSANCFGPLARFACGAEFTSKRISKRLGATRA